MTKDILEEETSNLEKPAIITTNFTKLLKSPFQKKSQQEYIVSQIECKTKN